MEILIYPSKTEDISYFIETQQSFKKGERFYMILEYFGNPRIAKAPWDGGWVSPKMNKAIMDFCSARRRRNKSLVTFKRYLE